METEGYRTCPSGIYPRTPVDRRRCGIRAGAPEDYSFKMNKKEKRLALKSVLTSKVQENKFLVLDELKLDAVKTKDMKKCWTT